LAAAGAGADGSVVDGQSKVKRRRSVKLNAVDVVQVEVRSGQWSAVSEKEKRMEEMSLGELLYCAVVECPERKRARERVAG